MKKLEILEIMPRRKVKHKVKVRSNSKNKKKVKPLNTMAQKRLRCRKAYRSWG